MQPRCHQARDMSHIHQQDGTDFAGNILESSKINAPWIGGSPGDDQLGLNAKGYLADLLHIEQATGAVNPV